MDDKTQALLKELFDGLPKPIQRAITSTDVQKRLRDLANKHKLHLDQWELLENEFLDSLLGLKPIQELEANIKNGLGISVERAAELAGDISETILAPIREELERELEHPEAKEKEVSGVEAARTQVLAGSEVPGTRQRAIGVESTVTMGVKPLETTPTPTAPLPPAPLPVTPVAPAPALVTPATPPPPPPTAKVVRMPASGAYRSGEASTVRKDVHDDPYREPPA